MKTKYKKFSKEYIKHLASLPQNRHLRNYQKWIRKQIKKVKQEKQIWHVVLHFKAKRYNCNFGVKECCLIGLL